MNSADLRTFNEAVTLANEGCLDTAHTLITRLQKLYSQEPNLLLWQAFTTTNLTEARRAIEAAARLEPGHASLPGAFAWLVEQEAEEPQTVQDEKTPPLFTFNRLAAQKQTTFSPSPLPEPSSSPLVKLTSTGARLLSQVKAVLPDNSKASKTSQLIQPPRFFSVTQEKL